jgi:hypothetical protein
MDNFKRKRENQQRSQYDEGFIFQQEIRGVIMPQMMLDVSVNNIAEIIKSMNLQEIETLYLLLTNDGKELLKRKKDFDFKRVKFLTREEAFDV